MIVGASPIHSVRGSEDGGLTRGAAPWHTTAERSLTRPRTHVPPHTRDYERACPHARTSCRTNHGGYAVGLFKLTKRAESTDQFDSVGLGRFDSVPNAGTHHCHINTRIGSRPLLSAAMHSGRRLLRSRSAALNRAHIVHRGLRLGLLRHVELRLPNLPV